MLHLDSNDLREIKRNTCITLSDETISLLPGIESSINNLTKTLQKKREEIRKQFERLRSITPGTVDETESCFDVNAASIVASVRHEASSW